MAMLVSAYARWWAAVVLAFAVGVSASAAKPAVPPLPEPAADRIAVKVIVVANFEPGADTGDAPGEFQFWAEREQLSEAIRIRGTLHPLMRNDRGLFGIVWGEPDTMVSGVSEQLAGTWRRVGLTGCSQSARRARTSCPTIHTALVAYWILAS